MNKIITTIQEQEREFVEKGADIEHDRWAKWQAYFFGKCQIKPLGQVGGMDDRYMYFALLKDLYERWKRQIATPYSQLSEDEKESDRKEVRSYLPMLRSSHLALLESVLEEVENTRARWRRGNLLTYREAVRDVAGLIRQAIDELKTKK